MVTIRNWRAATPVVAHDNVLRWTIMEQQDTLDFPPEFSPCTPSAALRST